MTDEQVTKGADEGDFCITPSTLAFAGVTIDELQLALTVFQQTTFQEWMVKLVAAGFQKRLDQAIKNFPHNEEDPKG